MFAIFVTITDLDRLRVSGLDRFAFVSCWWWLLFLHFFSRSQQPDWVFFPSFEFPEEIYVNLCTLHMPCTKQWLLLHRLFWGEKGRAFSAGHDRAWRGDIYLTVDLLLSLSTGFFLKKLAMIKHLSTVYIRVVEDFRFILLLVVRESWFDRQRVTNKTKWGCVFWGR